jgi:hypothetical protein
LTLLSRQPDSVSLDNARAHPNAARGRVVGFNAPHRHGHRADEALPVSEASTGNGGEKTGATKPMLRSVFAAAKS